MLFASFSVSLAVLWRGKRGGGSVHVEEPPAVDQSTLLEERFVLCCFTRGVERVPWLVRALLVDLEKLVDNAAMWKGDEKGRR